MPPDQAAVIGELVGQLRGARSVEDLYSILSTYQDSEISAVGEGARYGSDILHDGEHTIYNPEVSAVAAVASDPDDPPPERKGWAVVAVAGSDVAGAAGQRPEHSSSELEHCQVRLAVLWAPRSRRLSRGR